jgi:membrane peptidoglycan carboxypeptidase
LEPTDKNLERFGLAISLGGGEVRLLELAGGYATLASGGEFHEPVAILKVESKEGKVLEEFKEPKEREVMGRDVAFLISHILSDNNARSAVFGTGSYLNVSGKTVAVKTGTTDDKRDNWAVGYTPSVVVGVWVGNNDNSPMDPKIASGVTGATPIWNKIITAALSGKSNEGFNPPDNVRAIEIDALGGGLPCRDLPKRSEYFIKGTEPTRDCLVEKTLDGRDYYVFVEFDPISTDGKNRWQEGIDAWAASQGDDKYKPPKELVNQPNQTSTNPEDVKVEIKNPGDHSKVDFAFEVEAEVNSGKKITKVEFYVADLGGNYSLKDTKNDGSNPYKFNFTFAQSSKGKHKVKVKGYNEAGKESEKEIEIAVGEDW